MRKPLQSTGLAIPVTPPVTDTSFVQMGILKVNGQTGKIDENSKSLGILLLNPESISDEKSSNWVMTQIPGQSGPIMQWMSGGPRTVTFTALVTRDTSDFLSNNAKSPLAGVIDDALNAVGSIASAFAGVSLPAVSTLLSSAQPGPGEQLSIENELQYYRSLEYPEYVSGRLYASPPLVVLAAGRMLGSLGSTTISDISQNSDLWVLTNLKIDIVKTLPNLTPMEANVSFTFVQYAIRSFGSDHFGQHPIQGGSVGSPSLGSVISGKLGF